MDDFCTKAWWCYGTTNETMEEKMYEVGKNNVSEMRYHEPKSEGDRHYVDVDFDNGSMIRAFNPTEITF